MSFAVIGYLAGTLTTLSFVPQVVRAWPAHHTGAIALWFTYGVILHDWPMILANSTTMTLCSLLVFMKYRYSKSKAKVARVGVRV